MPTYLEALEAITDLEQLITALYNEDYPDYDEVEHTEVQLEAWYRYLSEEV